MTPRPALALLLAGLLLGGCLEVEQHPPWDRGSYDGKTDQLPHQARFHADRLAWNAALTDRTLLQDEYRRATRPGPAPGPRAPGAGAAKP